MTRCLSSLALLAGSACSARVSKSRLHPETKFVAGVPILNYRAAYAGESLGESGALEDWVVVVKDGVTNKQIDKLCAVAPAGCKLSGNPDLGGVPFFEMRGTETDLEHVINSGDGAVKYVEPDTLVYAIPELQAAEESDFWGLGRIGANKRSGDGAGITIFLTDTGVRASHREFGGRVIPTVDMSGGELKECNGDTSCAADRHGHGTHCAGIAAGSSAGVAPAASVRSVKVVKDQGLGSWSWTYRALDWMATSSVRPAIASMSFKGGRVIQNALRDAVDRATVGGVTVVVGAGNGNADACQYSPAFVPSAITVGSTDSRDRRSVFSNYGACTNIWAPGTSILSAGNWSDDGYISLSGTSMACHHVAGGAALLLELNPTLSREQLMAELMANSRVNSITDMQEGDTNKFLYVGKDAPPPPGNAVPTPAPATLSCPSDKTTGPDTNGDCRCNNEYRCRNDGRGCPVRWKAGLSSRFYWAGCSTCECVLD